MSFEKGLDRLNFIFLWGKSCVTSTSSLWKEGHAWGICSLTLLFRFKVDLCTGWTRKNIIKARGVFICCFWNAFYIYIFSLSHSTNKNVKENLLFFMKDKEYCHWSMRTIIKPERYKDKRIKGVWKCANMQTRKFARIGIFLQGWLTWYESEEGMAGGPVL